MSVETAKEEIRKRAGGLQAFGRKFIGTTPKVCHFYLHSKPY